jgi:AraC family transcriptional regulator, positive regulator of tynA and feaB
VQSESSPIVRLSTRDIAPADRHDYINWILSVTDPAAPTEWSVGASPELELEVTALKLPAVTIVAISGSPHRSVRRFGPRRTVERTFGLNHVFSGPQNVTHGTQYRLNPGDVSFTDSRHPFEYEFLTHYKDCYVQLPEQFMRKWVRNPLVLVGRRIGDSQWGRVLTSYMAQLSPEFVVQAPLPQAVLIDQLGALLALVASELSGSRAVTTPAERSVRDRVSDHIRQRCADTSLQAADIAGSLHISTRTLHRALGTCGETFGVMLIHARVDLAMRMLQSPLFDRVTTAEIGRRAGFSDASHFVKALRRRTGQTPLQMRRASHGKLLPPSATSAD